MRDIGLDKFLAGLIGIPGLAVCLLAWVQPMEIPEGILTTAIGIIGLTWALVRVLSLRSMQAKVSVRTKGTEGGKRK